MLTIILKNNNSLKNMSKTVYITELLAERIKKTSTNIVYKNE